MIVMVAVAVAMDTPGVVEEEGTSAAAPACYW